MKNTFRLLLLSLLTFVFTSGCAKAPNSVATNQSQLIVTLTVAGQINPNYYYFVLFNNTSNPSSSVGPIPVINTPWGNGFATGEFTSFMRYNQSQPNAGYEMFSITPGTNLLSFQYLGAPSQYTAVSSGGNTLRFQIPLSQLATSRISADQINSLQVNFITTDYIPVDPNASITKNFDALGDARANVINSPITISTQQSRVYHNSDFPPAEPSGDVTTTGNGTFANVNMPDLDIVDWTIEVRH